MLQQVIDGEDVGECQLTALDMCLSGSSVGQSGLLGPSPSGEGQSQLPHGEKWGQLSQVQGQPGEGPTSSNVSSLVEKDDSPQASEERGQLSTVLILQYMIHLSPCGTRATFLFVCLFFEIGFLCVALS